MKTLTCIFCTLAAAHLALARTISYAENKTDGVVTSMTVSFGADGTGGKTLGLYCAYGPSDAASDPSAWQNLRRWATVPASMNELTVKVPEGWGKTSSALRFFLFEEENAGLGYDTRVSYIQSSGSQIIDSGYVPKADTRFVLDMTGLGSPTCSSGYIFGYRTINKAVDSFGLYQSCGKNHYKVPQWNYGTNTYSNTKDFDVPAHRIDGRCVVSNDHSRVFVSKSGVSTCLNPTAPDDCGLAGTWRLAIFGAYYNTSKGVTGLCQVRIHSLDFYEGDVAKRQFIAVLKDGVPGLWDNVGNTFYTNGGSGAFTYGARQDNPVGQTTLVSSGETYLRKEPYVEFVVAGSGLSLHALGTLYISGATGGALDVYLAYAPNGTELPEATCVCRGWENDFGTRFNMMFRGLSASTKYNYSIYAKNAAGEKSETTSGSFTTGALIEVAANEDPVTAVNGAAAGSEVRIAEGTYVISATMTPNSSVAIVGQGAGAVLDANYVADRRIISANSDKLHLSLENLTFRNARMTNVNSGASWTYVGAGVRIGGNGGNSCSKVYSWVSNCVFTACTNVNTGAGGMWIEGGCKVIGCTFTGNYAGGGGSADAGAGAVVHCGADQTQFDRCVFSNNYCAGSGGALGSINYDWTGRNSVCGTNLLGTVLTHCRFANNRADARSGAVYGKFVSVEDCDFIDNRAPVGGVIWNGFPSLSTFTLRFSDSRFRGNRATTSSGGCFYNDYGRRVVISNCTFTANYAEQQASIARGDSYWFYDCTIACNTNNVDTTSDVGKEEAGVLLGTFPQVYGCTIRDNLVCGPSLMRLNGGTMDMRDIVFMRNRLLANAAQTDCQRAVLTTKAPGFIRNVVLANNTNECGYGCALATYCNYTTNDNLTIVGNRCYSSTGSSVGIYRNTGDNNRYRNCIVVDNRNLKTGTLMNFYPWGIDCCFSCLEDGTQLSAAKGNLTEADPRFRDPAKGDYTPMRRSPAWNTGLELGWMDGATDILGNPRIFGKGPDLGAYENIEKDPGLFLYIR